jgi:hypothetical protein
MLDKQQLKGGSLSETSLCTSSSGIQFIRKEASLTENREFGFQRLYSQLKRLQRYNDLFPNMFPDVISYGLLDDRMYFDLEYIPDSITLHEFLIRTDDLEIVNKVFHYLIEMMNTLHTRHMFQSTWHPIELYVREEMKQRIDVCRSNPRFKSFSRTKWIYFNGERCLGLADVLDSFLHAIVSSYQQTHTIETFSHGNLTLENILIQPSTGRLVFIDLYEENIIDAAVADYSQILQSSNSHYELWNQSLPLVHNNRVEASIPEYAGLNHFNTLFLQFLHEKFGDLTLVKLFEISQYARMLPFKMQINEDKMILFYALGSYLFHQLSHEN